MPQILRFLFLGLYLGLSASANASALPDKIKGMQIWEGPRPRIEASFLSPEGAPLSLADFEGKITVVNFWATWCAPCLNEMPALSRLKETLGAEATLLTIATGRNSKEGMDKFFERVKITNLPHYTDPNQDLARAFDVLGLPVTVILDEEGGEIARFSGEAEWDDLEVKDWILSLRMKAEE